ncbi:MAG: TatD family hydrolase [Limnobacter sp.]|nr:TatD family hydrolase [Limnobacter sp.]
MWTDTHLHLDAQEFQADLPETIERARNANVNRFVLPAVHPDNFDAVRQLAHATPGAVYCLGIHPCFVHHCQTDALDILFRQLKAHRGDPLLAAVGEIGLDGFIENPDWPKQTEFFYAQLRLAKDFDLPVVMHVRKSQDLILKGLRRFQPCSGIAHAFNGSFQQAEQFLKLNMCLGFGGASTFTRARQIRRLVAQMPDEALVLETDSPDIPPEWNPKGRNEPANIARIAHVISQLRQVGLQSLSEITNQNATRVLPALGRTGHGPHCT